MDPCARPWTMAGMGPSRIKSLTKFGIWNLADLPSGLHITAQRA